MLMTLNYKYKIFTPHYTRLGDLESTTNPQYNIVRKCKIFFIGSSLLEFLKNEKERSLIIEKIQRQIINRQKREKKVNRCIKDINLRNTFRKFL